MYILVGLGNPGEKYDHTRHNVGFDVVDLIAKNMQLDFHAEKIFHTEIAKSDEIVLVKPQTFMNESGLAVRKCAEAAHVSPDRIIVVHDDISLPLGTVKISFNAGAGKHNGVQSVIDHLGTQEFVRVRCGIGRGDGVLSDVVLSKFKPEEESLVQDMLQKASQACELIVQTGYEAAMNEMN